MKTRVPNRARNKFLTGTPLPGTLTGTTLGNGRPRISGLAFCFACSRVLKALFVLYIKGKEAVIPAIPAYSRVMVFPCSGNKEVK